MYVLANYCHRGGDLFDNRPQREIRCKRERGLILQTGNLYEVQSEEDHYSFWINSMSEDMFQSAAGFLSLLQRFGIVIEFLMTEIDAKPYVISKLIHSIN